MEDQMNIGKHNTQQMGQNPISQPVAQLEKPKTNYFVIGGIILVCFVVFGFGGYYLGKQSVNDEQNLRTVEKDTIPLLPSQLNIATTTPSVLEITYGWPTYTNNTYGFFFKYPEPDEELAMHDKYTDDLIEIHGIDHLVLRIEPIDSLDVDLIEWWNSQTTEAFTNKPTACFSQQTTTILKSLYDPNKALIDFGRDILLLNNFYSKENIDDICLEPPQVQILLVPHKGKIIKITYTINSLAEDILTSFKFID